VWLLLSLVLLLLLEFVVCLCSRGCATIADLSLWLMMFLWAPAGSFPFLIPLLEALPFNLAALVY
jgi:hypothetical protein